MNTIITFSSKCILIIYCLIPFLKIWNVFISKAPDVVIHLFLYNI